jgi:hypothetical protein
MIMTVEMLKEVLSRGDKYGSALKQMLKDLGFVDLCNVTDQQAKGWVDDYDKRNNTENKEI